MNASALEQFQKDLNLQANVRDYLISYSKDLPVTTPMSVALQASTLAQITGATNQLTRDASVKLFVVDVLSDRFDYLL